ncbi:tetratricopeptide repeat-containing protein [Mycena polygramma]|nr:tetratricopeptide repeat-containing protein [Mycena polygramma]
MNPRDLDGDIEQHRKQLALHALPHPDHTTYLKNLADALEKRSMQPGDSRGINEVVQLRREILGLHPPNHPDHALNLHTLALSVTKRFQLYKDPEDINEAIELSKRALVLRTRPHPDHYKSLNNLAIMFSIRVEQYGDSSDLDEAVALLRQVLASQPECSSYLDNLGSALVTRFKQRWELEDINEAVGLYRKALAVFSHPSRRPPLSNLASALQTRFRQQGELGDINEAIQLLRGVISVQDGHGPLPFYLSNLAGAIELRFQQNQDLSDINEAIELHRKALSLYGPLNPTHFTCLGNLGAALRLRFEHQGDLSDITEAIGLHRQVLTTSHQNHTSLNNLAVALQTRYRQHGDSTDIKEAIELNKQALNLCKPTHSGYGLCLNNLAAGFQSRFEKEGNPKDIDATVELYRQAVSFYLPGDPNRGMSLSNLANAVQTRFEQWGDPSDIDEALVLHKEALQMHSLSHHSRGNDLHNTALALFLKGKHYRDRNDVDKGIELCREAVALFPPPHPHRGNCLNSLAAVLHLRYELLKNQEDIDEAIQVHREALLFLPRENPAHSRGLNNLAASLQRKNEEHGNLTEIDEAIRIHEEVLTLRLSPHPERGSSLQALAIGYIGRYGYTHRSEDLDQACALFKEATAYLSSSPSTCLRHAHSWATNAARYNHGSALVAYQTAIQLLPRMAALHLDLSSRREILSTASAINLASEGASCAIEQGQFDIAVELLEAGRSVFWSQALHLQTPLNNLATIRPDLAAKLAEISSHLEKASFRDVSISRATFRDSQHKIIVIEAQGAQCRKLNEDWDQCIESIQMLPGFEDFMQPKRIVALRQAAVSGPIVILTTSHSTSSALIVRHNKEVQMLNLPKLDVHLGLFLAELSRGLSNPGFDLGKFTAKQDYTQRNGEEASSEFLRLPGRRERREGNIDMSSHDVFEWLLAYLWENIVEPVFEALKLEKSDNPSRLWWCPTGSLVFLPIHAAGIYTNERRECASDYVISSYTPNLTALLDPPMGTPTLFKMTAVGQRDTPGHNILPGAKQELQKISERVPNIWLASLMDTTVETALTHLRESSVMHFACHGTQNLEKPLDSGLILKDGQLKISEIMHWPEGRNTSIIKKSLSLAFLSACETARGDQTVPDEAMHLAATLLFAGFHGVVATMWTMDDRDGPNIADMFYEHLFRDCDPAVSPPIFPDLTQAAKALHLAVAKLRKDPNISFERWVPFVHYGL